MYYDLGTKGIRLLFMNHVLEFVGQKINQTEALKLILPPGVSVLGKHS